MPTLQIGLTGSAVVTGSRSYTLSDTAVQNILDWAEVAFATEIQSMHNPNNTPGFEPTNAQIMATWVQSWINGTKDAVNRELKFKDATTAANNAPQIVIT